MNGRIKMAINQVTDGHGHPIFPSPSLTAGDPQQSCFYCSTETLWVYHPLEVCPRIKEIEYDRNGTVKKVIFKEKVDECSTNVG